MIYAFGDMYVADLMAHVLKLFAVVTTALMLVYAQGYARARGLWKGELFTLSLFALLGTFVMISGNNLLVIYLGLELMSLSLYALVALRRDDARATEAAMKYFVLGALASGFLLYGMSMLYGATGTLDINELAKAIGANKVVSRAALVLATVFIVAGIGFKIGGGAVPHVGARRLSRRTDAGRRCSSAPRPRSPPSPWPSACSSRACCRWRSTGSRCSWCWRSPRC